MIIDKYKIETLKVKISEYINGIAVSKVLNVEDKCSWLDRIDVILENTLIKYSNEEVQNKEFLTYFIEKSDEDHIYIGYYHKNRKVIDVVLGVKDNVDQYILCKNVQVIVHEREFKI